MHCVQRAVDAKALAGQQHSQRPGEGDVWLDGAGKLGCKSTLIMDGLAPVHSLVNAATAYLHEQCLTPTRAPLVLNSDETEFSSDAEMFEVLCSQLVFDPDDESDFPTITAWTWQPGACPPREEERSREYVCVSECECGGLFGCWCLCHKSSVLPSQTTTSFPAPPSLPPILCDA